MQCSSVQYNTIPDIRKVGSKKQKCYRHGRGRVAICCKVLVVEGWQRLLGRHHGIMHLWALAGCINSFLVSETQYLTPKPQFGRRFQWIQSKHTWLQGCSIMAEGHIRTKIFSLWDSEITARKQYKRERGEGWSTVYKVILGYRLYLDVLQSFIGS